MGDTGDGPSRRPEAEGRYAAHLSRSEKQWNRWSDWYGLSESDFAPIREALIDGLDLDHGDRVLDVGCGPGVNFGALHDQVTSAGEIVGLDYSPRMIERAEERVAEHEWDNVRVVRGDATTADLGAPYDAAIATLSLSVMPDIERTLENIHGALRPESPLGILDVRPIPGGPGRILNPLLRRFLRWYANWNPAEDVLPAVETVFPELQVLETRFFGTIYTARATTDGS